MTGRREEFAEKEHAGWRAFLEVVHSVPEGQVDVEGVVPGWSVKDLVWHCAEWARFASDHLQQMEGGTFVDPFDGVDGAHWDAVSQQQIDESRTMTWDEVLAGAEARRARLRDVWSSLSEVDDEAAKWFADETFGHYDEHAKEIKRFMHAS